MKTLKKSLLLGLTAAVMALYPVAALAEDPATTPTDTSSATTQTTDTNSSSTPAETTPPTTPTDPAPTTPTPTPTPVVTPPTNTQGPTSPTGADAKKYVYNPATGKYENDYYVWDPVTKKTSPKVAPTYSYNPTTGMWDTTEWVYDAPSGKYVPNVKETPAVPAGAQVVAPTSAAKAAGTAANGIDTTGPGSSNLLNNNTTNNGTFDLFYNAAISNNITQNAVSGNAILTGNTTAGNATTGSADNVANVINMLQSTWSPLTSGNLVTFSANIDGDVHGDLMVDTGAMNTGPGSTNVVDNNTTNNLTVNAQGSGTINNNINVNSQSGDATVSGNTTGGNATTGNATALVNLINAINTSIASGQSFMGTININGNLDGDILLPPDVLNALIAASGPDSNNQINNTTNNSLTANLTNNQAINNNVNANATTGAATVSGNTTGGDATSGNAQTKVNILNLTGREVVGKDALLVFVNVLGQWTGLIMNAPTGTTSALVGGGVDSNNLINNNANNNVDLTATTTNTINNNVNVNAQSGDADVSHNTTGGNAKTGDATASVNIANLNGSNLSFSDWFGVLFINVFGSWNGSFGVNTSAGDPPAQTVTESAGGTTAVAVPEVLKFVAKANTGTQKVAYAAVSSPVSTESHETQQTSAPAVLGSDNNTPAPQAAPSSAPATQANLLWVPFVGSGLGLLILLASEIARRRSALHSKAPIEAAL